MFTTIRNWRKVVKSFEGMSNRQIIAYLKKNNFKPMHKVYKWSNREVFALNDHYVIKVARSNLGVYQNQTEINTFDCVQMYEPKYLKYLVPVMLQESDTVNHIFVVMKMARKPENKLERKELYGRAIDGKDGKFHKAIEYIDSFMDTENAKDLKHNNLGIYKGTTRVLDYGCGREVGKEFNLYRRNGHNYKLALRYIYPEA